MEAIYIYILLKVRNVCTRLSSSFSAPTIRQLTFPYPLVIAIHAIQVYCTLNGTDSAFDAMFGGVLS